MEIDKEKVRKLFERYDKNKNDTLEKKEFMAQQKDNSMLEMSKKIA